MLVGKTYAYHITGSAAILSDAAESVVHVVAVAFAAYSMWLSHQPADESHPYGHEKIGFFSAGIEGGMIALAAIFIIYESVRKWVAAQAGRASAQPSSSSAPMLLPPHFRLGRKEYLFLV